MNYFKTACGQVTVAAIWCGTGDHSVTVGDVHVHCTVFCFSSKRDVTFLDSCTPLNSTHFYCKKEKLLQFETFKPHESKTNVVFSKLVGIANKCFVRE